MARLSAPASGVTVRMYRHGHGDCLLLAFRDEQGDPVYMLVDCGLLPGSAIDADIEEIVTDIREATGDHLHVVVMTHEHQDHVSGFRSARALFDAMTIDACWLAWTEDGADALANRLREDYGDTLLGLVGAARLLSEAPGVAERRLGERVRSFLEFEVEGENVLAASIEGIRNKEAINVVRDRVTPTFLRPHRPPTPVPSVPGVRVFVLGPPRNEARLREMDPTDEEGYHVARLRLEDRSFVGAALHRSDRSWAARAGGDVEDVRPFGDAYGRTKAQAFRGPHGRFFAACYGRTAEDHAQAWRRIDEDWLRAAEALALRLNSYTNNTSLALAIELPRSRRVLLFTGDAQRGNWLSWHDHDFEVPDGEGGTETITARDLLGRTVFYKVGHHGSHNATLRDPGLEDMAQGAYEEDFVAMIPSHDTWAKDVKDWTHPLPSIKSALREKARGRVFLARHTRRPRRPSGTSEAEWEAFRDRARTTRLYHQYTVPDEE